MADHSPFTIIYHLGIGAFFTVTKPCILPTNPNSSSSLRNFEFKPYSCLCFCQFNVNTDVGENINVEKMLSTDLRTIAFLIL